MNGVNQSAEAVRKNMKEIMKTNKIVNMRCFIKRDPFLFF